MDYLFEYAVAFDQDIGKWHVSKVTAMRGMFQYASTFNQDISVWDVAAVTSMYAMFYDAKAFNQNLADWCAAEGLTGGFAFSSGSSCAVGQCGANGDDEAQCA